MKIMNSKDIFKDCKSESFILQDNKTYYKATTIINTEDRKIDHWVRIEIPDPYVHGNFI